MSHPRDDSDEPSSCPGSVVSAPHAIDRIEHEFTSTCHNDDDEGTHAVDLSAFEHQKENIQPRKQGRSARALAALCSSDPDALTRPSNARARALVPKPVPGPSPCEGDDAHEGTSSGSSSSGSCLPLIQQGHHDFQAAIAAMDPDTDDDPLDVHFRYTRWALEVRTQGGALPDLLQIFEKPLRLFRGQERYRNDTRYVKMWIWYTTIIKKGQEEVFKYLLANNVGDALAMFYEEYADLLEGRGKTALADEIYLLGINRKAQPLDRLRRRHENFQRRIIALEKRRAEGTTLTDNNNSDDYDYDDDDHIYHGDEGAPAPRRTTAGIQSSSSSSSSSRAMLGVKPSARVARSVHPNTLPAGQRGLRSLGQRPTPAGVSARGHGPLPSNSNNNNTKITVFSDPDGSAAQAATTSDAREQSGGGWLDIGTHATRFKENTQDASTWRGQKLKQNMVGPRVVSGTIQRGPPTQMSEKFEVFQDEGDSDEAARESVRTAAQGNEAGGGILSAKTKDKCGDSEDGSTPSDRFLRSIEQQEQQQEQEPAKPLPSDRSAKSEKKPILLPPSSSTSVAKRTGRFCLDFTLLGLANHCQDNPEFELPLCVEEARAQLAQYYFDITKWRHMIQSQREAAKSTSAGASTEYDASQGREEDVLDGDIRLSRKNHRSGENLPSPTINTRVAQAEMFDIWNEQDNEDEGRDNRSDGTTSDDGGNDDDDDDENEEEDDGLNEFERERSMKRLTADASGAKALVKQRSALNDDYQFTMGPVEPNSNPYSSHVADIYSANSASMEQQCANTKSTTRTTPMVVVAASQQAEGSGGCKRRDENDPPTVMIKRMPRDGAGEGIAEPTPQQARAKRSVAPLTVKTPAVSSLAKPSGPATFEVFCDGQDAPAQANLPPASRTPAATSQASEAGHSGGCSDKQQTVVPWHSTPALGSRRRGYDYEEMITGMSQVGIDPNSGQTMSTIHPVSGGLTTAMLGGNNATHTFGVTGEYDVAEEVTGTMHPHVVVTNINANLDTPATAIRTRHNAQSVGITPRFPASRICQDPIGEEDEDEDEDVGDGDEWQKNSEENAVVIDDNVLMSSQMDGGGSASKAKTIAPSTFMFYLDDDDGRSGSKHPDSPLEDKSSFIKTVRPTNKSPPPFKVYSACPDNGEEGEGDEDEEGGGNDESTTTTATDNQDFTGAPGRPSLQDQPQEGRTEQDQHPTIVKPFWPLERSVYLVILDAAPEPVEFFAGYCNCYEHPLREALKSTQDQLRIIMTTDAAGTAGGKGPKPITLSAFNDDEEDEEEDMEFQRLRQRLRVRTVPLHLGLKDQPDTAPYRRFEVERMLKEGGNAVVYLAMNAAEEQEEMAQCVLKVESPPNMWEFFILNTLKDRMAEAAKMFASNTPTFASAEWVVMPECVYEYSDYSVTVLPYCTQGSLLDVVNAWNQAGGLISGGSGGICSSTSSSGSSNSGGLDEGLVMLIVTHLIRAVLEIHRLGCVHTDLKAENVMLNLTDAMLSDPSCVLSAKVPANPSALDEGFEPQSPCSLVRLIDFGRAIDWTVFDPLQQLRVHDINHDDKVRAGGNQTDPVELDEVPAWSPHADWVGVAKIAHLLLFGCRLRTQPIDASSCLRDVIRPGKVPRDIVKTTTTTLRRYWQTDLWRRLFAICLSGFPEPTAIDPSLGPAINVDAVWKGDLKQRIEPAMLELLQDMESWLVEWYIKRRSDVDRGLPSLLRRLYLKTSAYCV